MLYLGIDQHKRQVSTQWEKVRAFFADLAEKARPEGGFLAIVAVHGLLGTFPKVVARINFFVL